MSHLPGPNFWIFFGVGVALLALVVLVFLCYLGLLDEADQATSIGADVPPAANERRQLDQFLAAEADYLSPRQQFRQGVLEARRWRGAAELPANDLDGFAQQRGEVHS